MADEFELLLLFKKFKWKEKINLLHSVEPLKASLSEFLFQSNMQCVIFDILS